MIELKKLSMGYQLGKEKISVLKDIQLEIEEGEFLSILGSSGCGKSTLLNIIGGLEQDITGNLIIDGVDIKNFREREWVQIRKKKIGFIFQSFNLIPHLNAQENVELAMRFAGVSEKECKERALQLLKMVNLEERSTFLPSQLSGGQKQRVAIARALANEPEVILADEPTGALDSKSSAEVMEILHRINQEQGVTVVMVTHNNMLAQDADRIVYMSDGRIEKLEVKRAVNQKNAEQKGLNGKNDKISILSSVKLGIKNILLKRKRSLLTIFGTAVGIVGMVLMLGIGYGAGEKINHELRNFLGDQTIWVTKKNASEPMNAKDVEKIKSVDGVEVVLNNELFESTFYYNGKSAEELMDVLGPKDIATEYEQSLADIGSVPVSDDSKEIVLSSKIAKALVDKGADIEELVGKKIDVLTRLKLDYKFTYEVKTELKVTGISETGFLGGSTFIPYETAIELAKQSLKSNNLEERGAEVRALEPVFDDVVQTIRDMGYDVTNNKEDFESLNMIVLAAKLFLALIAGISMLVSAIMIKIVLQTNVVERTKEIGVMMALGASKREIKRIFVVEATLLGFSAGIVGIGIGQIAGMILNGILKKTMEGMNFNLYLMSGKTVIICLVLSIFVAICAGRKPAVKASRIAPVEALRYE